MFNYYHSYCGGNFSTEIFVYGDIVYAQTWEALTLKNCIESP